MSNIDTDDYWTIYDKALDAAATCRRVEALIGTLGRYYPPSSGVAFFPNGADRDLLGTLTDAGQFGECHGNFHDPPMVNGFLEWGRRSLNGTGWIPHSVTVRLGEGAIVARGVTGHSALV